MNNGTTFSTEEVEGLLKEVGFIPDTPEFRDERTKRFYPDGQNMAGSTLWVERDDWVPASSTSAATKSPRWDVV